MESYYIGQQIEGCFGLKDFPIVAPTGSLHDANKSLKTIRIIQK